MSPNRLFGIAIAIAISISLQTKNALAGQCVHIDWSASFADFWANDCSSTVGIRWADSNGVCNYDCLVYIGPQGRTEINKQPPNTNIQWSYCTGKSCYPKVSASAARPT